MRTSERWDRVAATIAAEAGLAVDVETKSYPGGVSFSITRRLPSGDVIGVHDKWWRKNHDVWIGYQVHVEDRGGIVRRAWPITKKRTEVVAAVREALALVEAA